MLNNIKQNRMEKKITKKQEAYMCTFKDSIRDKAELLGIKNDQMNVLLQYIYDYEKLSFGKEDFTKRKRVKNVVPMFELCCAKRANESRCTRRKKDGSCFGLARRGPGMPIHPKASRILTPSFPWRILNSS